MVFDSFLTLFGPGTAFTLVLTTALGPSALLYYENTVPDLFVANKYGE
jgi:hypothetical protein